MKIFQNKIFILILIISVISVSLPEIVQAGPAVGLLIGFLVNVLVMDILVITTIGIVGDIIFIASLFCTFGGPIGDCDEAEGGGVFIAVMPQDINCAFVQGVTFYNTLPHDRENDSTRQIKIYRFTKPTSISSERLAYWLTKSWPFTNDSVPLLIGKGITLEKGSGRVVAEAMKSLRTGGYLDVSAYYRSGAVPAAYATVNYSDICDDSGVCTFNDILPEKSYVAYVAKVMGAYDLLSPAYFYNETAPSFPDAIGLGYGDDGLYGCDSSRSAFVVPSLGDPLWDWWNDLTWRQKGLRGPFAKDDTFNADSYQLVTWKCDNKFLSSKEGKYPYRMSRTYSKVPPIINVYKTGSLDSCGEDGDEDGDLANVAIIGTDCDSITLSINPLSSDVTKYDIERDGVLIAQSVPISQTTYQDTGLTGGVTYSYNITVRTDSGIFQDFGPVESATKCLPTCSFSANPDALIYPDTDSTLFWDCDDAVNCSISQGIGDVCNDATTCENGGNIPITVDKTTLFVLTCENDDGDQTFSTAIINVNRPTIREISPRKALEVPSEYQDPFCEDC